MVFYTGGLCYPEVCICWAGIEAEWHCWYSGEWQIPLWLYCGGGQRTWGLSMWIIGGSAGDFVKWCKDPKIFFEGSDWAETADAPGIRWSGSEMQTVSYVYRDVL